MWSHAETNEWGRVQDLRREQIGPDARMVTDGLARYDGDSASISASASQEAGEASVVRTMTSVLARAHRTLRI
jgi:hypothetical protein